MSLWNKIICGPVVDEVLSIYEVQALADNLDRLLHPSGRISIDLWAGCGAKGEPVGLEIHPFHLASLDEYIAKQSVVRTTLLDGLRKEGHASTSDVPEDSEVWKGVQSMILELRPRKIVDVQTLFAAFPALAGSDVTEDTPETRSFFTIELKTIWDEEYVLRCGFRDGEFVGWARE